MWCMILWIYDEGRDIIIFRFFEIGIWESSIERRLRLGMGKDLIKVSSCFIDYVFSYLCWVVV